MKKRFKAVPGKGIVASTLSTDIQSQPATKLNVLKALDELGVDTTQHTYFADSFAYGRQKFKADGDYFAAICAMYPSAINYFEDWVDEYYGDITVGKFLEEIGKSVQDSINQINYMDSADRVTYLENCDTDEVLYEEEQRW